MTEYNFPFAIDKRGGIQTIDEQTHIIQLIEQLLFTIPGERVNRPTFGTGLNQLVFAPNSPELATATQFLIQGALQQYLGNIITIKTVQVTSSNSTLEIVVKFSTRQNPNSVQMATYQKVV